MRQKIRVSISIILTAMLVCSSALGYERDVHDRYMCQVLFGQNFKKSAYNEIEKLAIEALEAASFLATDQYNADSLPIGAKALETLSSYRVPSLPSSIDEINFRSNQHHRQYTHRGWFGGKNSVSNPYGNDKANWNIRKEILRQTTKKVFVLNDQENGVMDGISGLIYYTHILGDHIAETDYKKMNSDLIAIGGRHDDYDIIHQLIDHFDVLFTSPTSTYRYNSFRAQLLLKNAEFCKLIYMPGGINSAERQASHSKLAKELMDLLIKHVPGLLQEEAYFTNVFPARSY